MPTSTKKFGLTVLALLTLSAPLKTNAAVIDSFMIDYDGKRDFKKEIINKTTKKFEKIRGCGYSIIAKFDDESRFVKINVFAEDLNYKAEPPKKEIDLSTNVEVSLVRRNGDGSFSIENISEPSLGSEWLSRKIKISEFPSNNLQLGGQFAWNLLRYGFNLNVGLEGDFQKPVEIKPDDITKRALGKLDECSNGINKTSMFRWVDYYKLPITCYYSSKGPECAEKPAAAE